MFFSPYHLDATDIARLPVHFGDGSIAPNLVVSSQAREPLQRRFMDRA
jgi:hypothetical protein